MANIEDSIPILKKLFAKADLVVEDIKFLDHMVEDVRNIMSKKKDDSINKTKYYAYMKDKYKADQWLSDQILKEATK